MKKYCQRAGLSALIFVFVVACDTSSKGSRANIAFAADGSPAKAGEVLAKINQDNISEHDLAGWLTGQDKGRYLKAQTELYNQKKQFLQDMIFERMLETRAKDLGKTKEQLLEAEVSKKIKPVSEADVKKFYDDIAAQAQGRPGALPPFDQIKDRIRERLVQEKEEERRQAYFNELTHRFDITYFIAPPRVDVAVGDSTLAGTKDAPITVVVFSDFECPYCKKGYEVLDEVKTNYKGKVQIFFRDFPLGFHKRARLSANAVRCAGDQGKFWEMHDLAFQKQQDWVSKGEDKEAREELAKLGASLGLKRADLQACIDSEKYFEQIGKDMEAGVDAGVSGTPAFFVNGIMLSGALPFAEFKKVIDEELARVDTTKK